MDAVLHFVWVWTSLFVSLGEIWIRKRWLFVWLTLLKRDRSITATPLFLLSFTLVGNDEVKDHMSNFNFVHFPHSHNNPFRVAGWLNSSVIMQSKQYPTLPTNAWALVLWIVPAAHFLCSISQNLCSSTSTCIFSLFYLYLKWDILQLNHWKYCESVAGFRVLICYLCFSWIYCNFHWETSDWSYESVIYYIVGVDWLSPWLIIKCNSEHFSDCNKINH